MNTDSELGANLGCLVILLLVVGFFSMLISRDKCPEAQRRVQYFQQCVEDANCVLSAQEYDDYQRYLRRQTHCKVDKL